MVKKNWQKELGWNAEQLDELRTTGFSYIRQGKYDLALPFFEALLVLDSQDSYDYQTLGALYVELNQPSRALRYLDRALKMEGGEHTPTLLNLTKAFFMLGKKDDALRLCRILKDDPIPAISNMAKAMILAYS